MGIKCTGLNLIPCLVWIQGQNTGNHLVKLSRFPTLGKLPQSIYAMISSSYAHHSWDVNSRHILREPQSLLKLRLDVIPKYSGYAVELLMAGFMTCNKMYLH